MCDRLHGTRDTWYVGGGQPSLKISAPQLLGFGSECLLNEKGISSMFVSFVCIDQSGGWVEHEQYHNSY